MALLMVGFCSACNESPKTSSETVMAIDTLEAADSARYAHLQLHIELPVAADGVATAIRSRLVDLLSSRLTYVTSYENERLFEPFSGDAADNKALTDYYRSQLIGLLDSLSMSDAQERIKYINEAAELSDEEKIQQESEIPGWEYSYELRLLSDTLGYVVFLSQDYIYMGGAHGGIGGDGCLTFDREDGTMVEQMLVPDCVEAIQPLLVRGLVSYYSDLEVQLSEAEVRDRLQIEGDLIPLPVQQPYPSKDGLVFTYNQYEIACYADGMPSFVIPYEDIAPLMTPLAKKVCGLND